MSNYHEIAVDGEGLNALSGVERESMDLEVSFDEVRDIIQEMYDKFKEYDAEINYCETGDWIQEYMLDNEKVSWEELQCIKESKRMVSDISSQIANVKHVKEQVQNQGATYQEKLSEVGEILKNAIIMNREGNKLIKEAIKIVKTLDRTSPASKNALSEVLNKVLGQYIENEERFSKGLDKVEHLLNLESEKSEQGEVH